MVHLFGRPADDGDHDAPIRTKPKEEKETLEQRFCQHHRMEIDEQARRCYCRDCGDEIPLFDALKTFKDEFERYTERRRRARLEARRAEDRLAELDRREKNAKARLRRADKWLHDREKEARKLEPPELTEKAKQGKPETLFRGGYNWGREQTIAAFTKDTE